MVTAAQRKEHILNRIGYGQGTWASARYDTLGATGYVNEQLAQTLPPIVESRERSSRRVEKGARSMGARRQLEAVLCDFWFNHFNVDATTFAVSKQIYPYDQFAILANVLGTFPDMLTAVAKSPSMSEYLDNRQNIRPLVNYDTVLGGFNENYARELLELHTLGLNGGYVEADILGVARLLSGWNYIIKADVFETWPFNITPLYHDTDAKTVLGVTYPAGGGLEEGEALLNFLGTHPSTANFVCYKLCRRLIGDDPPAAAIAAAAETFTVTSGDLTAVTTAILSHPAFTDPATRHYRGKAKPPHRFAYSAMMAMGVSKWNEMNTPNAEVKIWNLMVEAGDTPFLFGAPTGYPENAEHWLSPVAMLVRFELAQMIAYDAGARTKLQARTGVNGSDLAGSFQAIQQAMLPGGVSNDTRNAALDHAAVNASTNEERVSAIAHMLLCSPEFGMY